MRLDIYKSLWGMEGPVEAQLARIKAAGYVGVEAPVAERPEEFATLLARYDLRYIAMIFTRGANGAEHGASYRRELARAVAAGPVKITAHSGRDSFSREEALEFYAQCAAEEAKYAVPVGHETHRGRVFFTPWTTAAVLRECPALRLCCDFSHWCCVCESMLEAYAPEVALAGSRAVHVHGRVGYEQGPQVTDPAAPEYAGHVARHEAWWQAIWTAQRARGETVATFTPEFGPPGYQHTLPYTRQPIADLWGMCGYMAQRTREQWAQRE